jgi:predicted RNase H-like nuclease
MTRRARKISDTLQPESTKTVTKYQVDVTPNACACYFQLTKRKNKKKKKKKEKKKNDKSSEMSFLVAFVPMSQTQGVDRTKAGTMQATSSN